MKEGWEVKKLGDVCIIERGGSPRPINAYLTDSADGINWIKIGDASEGSKYITSTKERIKPEGVKKSRMVHKGDFILSNSMSFGRPYILNIDGCIHDGWLVIHDKNNVFDKSYLYYYLGSPNIYREFQRLAVGGVVNNLNSELVRNVQVAIPPLPEQSRIVEELDLLSNIIEKKRQQLSELDNLAQSIFYDMFGDPVTNEKGWEVKKLKDIAVSQIGLTYKPENVSTEGTVVLRSSNIQDSCLDFSDIVRVNCNIKDKQYVQEGDILMCSRNGSFRLVGKVAMIKNLQERMSYGAFMTIIRSQYQDFLFAFFKSPAFRVQLTTAKTATINQITVKMLDEIRIPLPPFELQQLFAQIIEAIEKEKELIKQSIKETEELFNSRMDYYFG